MVPTAEQVRETAVAGGAFVISPNTDPELSTPERCFDIVVAPGQPNADQPESVVQQMTMRTARQIFRKKVHRDTVRSSARTANSAT